MKYKKIILVILILINIYSIFKVNHLSTVGVENNIPIEPLIATLTAAYMTNGKTIPDKILNNVYGEQAELYKLLKNKKALIMLYSELSCNSCTDSMIAGCNKLYQRGLNVIMIAHSNNFEYVKRFTRINKIKYSVLWDKNKEISSALNIRFMPAVLMVDEKKQIINSFFIESNIKRLNSAFFKALNSMLEKK